jgi:hypothetical protein
MKYATKLDEVQVRKQAAALAGKIRQIGPGAWLVVSETSRVDGRGKAWFRISPPRLSALRMLDNVGDRVLIRVRVIGSNGRIRWQADLPWADIRGDFDEWELGLCSFKVQPSHDGRHVVYNVGACFRHYLRTR